LVHVAFCLTIAATAYKPLSFTFGNDIIEGRYVSLDRIDNLVARIVNKLKAKVNAVVINDVTISDIDFSGIDFTAFNQAKTLYIYQKNTANYDIAINTTGVAPAGFNEIASQPVGADMSNDIATLINTLQGRVNTSLDGANADIQALINEVKKLQADVISYADRSINFETRVSNFLEKELNRVISKVATDGFTRVLEPIILFQLNDNYAVNRFFNGIVIPAGKVDLIPTTMTYELLAPAYMKYVAVKAADGSFAVQKVLTKGDSDFNKVTADLAAGDYTVIYSAVDFSGNQIAKKYNITVK
jgi:hypothetical protein